MDYPIRPITAEEAPAFFTANAIGFHHDPRPAESIANTLKFADLERSISVWDGNDIVGTAGTWTFDMSVPGGSVPCGGLTWVAVLPSHRRKGILTAMMRNQLDSVRDRGEPIAALWASESSIYGRFGYGLAAEGIEEMKIDRKHTALGYCPSFSGRIRFVDRAEALAKWPPVWDAVRAVRPGMQSRSPAWWEHRNFREPPWPAPPGYAALLNIQYEEDGTVLGFARYRVKDDWRDGLPAGVLNVSSLVATTDAAYAALWSHIFGVDLVETIIAEWRPLDEPLFAMLADSRRLARRPGDSLWVRMVDIPRALEARRYSAPGGLILEVTDEFCPWNAGRYSLEGGPDGATCKPTAAAPDVRLTSTELGALYLGGGRAYPLARAGRIKASDESLRLLDAMFGWSPLPWSPEVW